MLVNLPQDWDASYREALRNAGFEEDPTCAQFGPGLYHGLTAWAFDHLVETEYPFQGCLMAPNGTDEELRKLFQEVQRQEQEDEPQDYGVCDYPSQVTERWPQLAADPRPFIINFFRVQPDKDWKPEKHGKHIGTRKPWKQSVWIFHIYQLKAAS